jgi:Zn-dependent protease/predicted transcriptional regulator
LINHSFRIGKLAGIDIYIHFSWIIALILLTVSLASSWFPRIYPHASVLNYLLTGLIASLLLFLSVLLHELGHSLVARAHALPVKNIVLFIFGGVANIEEEAQSAGVEFKVAAIGPLVSLIIAGVCFLLWIPLRFVPSPVAAILYVLWLSNLLIGMFNLLPGFPLDGGRILKAIVWKFTGSPVKATRTAANAGMMIAYLLIIWGIFQFFSGDTLDGIWIGFIGWFLLSASLAERTQSTFEAVFSGVNVGQVMNRDPLTVPANISLQKLVDAYLLPHGLPSALVMQGDDVAGLITLANIRQVPRENWSQTPIGLAMIPADRLPVISPEQSLKEVLHLLADANSDQLPVLQNGHLVGIVSREELMRSLQVRQNLGLNRAA